MFASDRDLLVLEPMLFQDVRWPSQLLLRGRCTVDGTTLALDDGNITFALAQTREGSVVLAGEAALEVIERLDAKKIMVSRVKPASSAPIPAGSFSGDCSVTTFAAQLDLVHRAMLRMAGLGTLDRFTVLNAEDAREANAVGALAQIFLAASNGAGMDHPHAQRAALYQKRFEGACERLSLVLDTDNDGRADATRRLAGSILVRG